MGMFAVFGNPIQHSKSPSIHQMFAKQTGIDLEYQKILAPVEDFEAYLSDFFEKGGQGATLHYRLKKGLFNLSQS